uniref:Uncharacterized protein n=1 Tax=Alexandrium catenella TaxID=2925 RepID=A0A7S1WGA2_ALECA|mmetsp:Transcript_58623/g.156957  ORF Transcript_58623/g.156957 Transcript_58623/m.156957 type:complete len:315 (+) Transcript_58623:80-1024(+)
MKQSSAELLHVVCFVHLIICLAFICVPSDQPLELGGVLVYPTLQWVYATFCCFCGISVVAAGVGTVYNIAVHIDIYYYVLLLSALADVAWLVLFLVFGHSCRSFPSGTHKNPHLMKVVTCAVTSGGVLVCLILLFAFKVVGMAAATRTAAEARSKQCEELLPYLDKSMGQMASAEGRDALQSPAEDTYDPQHGYPAQQWQGPGMRMEPSLSFRSAPHPSQGAARGPPATYGSVENLSAPELGEAAVAARSAAVALSGPTQGELEAMEAAAPTFSRQSSSAHSTQNPFGSIIFGPGELPKGIRPEDLPPSMPAVR